MDLCKDASDLAHSTVLKIILTVMIIISTTAIFLEMWVMFKTTNRILVHQNTRILLIVHQLWLILHCITRIFAHTYVLAGYQKSYVDQCEYMKFPWECFMIRTPASLTSNLNAASIPMLAIERAIATYFSSRYEIFGKSVAVILIIAQRFHRSKVHISLSQRYQIMENINSLQTLTPMMAFYSLFLALYLGALFAYFALGSKFSLRNTIYLESVQQTPIYALTLPIAIVWTEKYVRKIIQENRQKAMEFKGNEANNHYFSLFRAPPGKNA